MLQRRHLLSLAGSGLLMPVCAWAGLSEGDAVSGVREALARGADAALLQLGRTDGFLGDARVRIELPGALKDVARLLQATGQGRKVDELVTAMNRAAESAMPQARQVLVQAVRSMSVEDGVRIVRGGDDSVTQFFAGKTREPLTRQLLPIVTRATERQQLAQRYNAVAEKAAGMGLLRQDDAHIENYVTGKALDGLYLVIGEEERKIRRDPLGTGSALLKKVFGGL